MLVPHPGDILQAFKAALGVHLLDVVLQGIQGERGFLVGVRLEGDPFHLQVIGELGKDCGDFPILHDTAS